MKNFFKYFVFVLTIGLFSCSEESYIDGTDSNESMNFSKKWTFEHVDDDPVDTQGEYHQQYGNEEWGYFKGRFYENLGVYYFNYTIHYQKTSSGNYILTAVNISDVQGPLNNIKSVTYNTRQASLNGNKINISVHITLKHYNNGNHVGGSEVDPNLPGMQAPDPQYHYSNHWRFIELNFPYN